MPMVPEDFAPSVTEGAVPMTPATGPWVSPMKNRAPSLLQQTGDALARTGSQASQLGNTIGDHVQATMDEALTKSAETQFLKSSQDVLSNPQSGYLNTRGLNAQTEWDPATKAIAKARQDARATLTNPIQQRMFDQVTNDHMLTLGRSMADHQHQQVTQYGIQQSQDRADSMNILAKTAYLSGRMDDYLKYSDQSMDETLHVAALNGAAPESDVAKAMLRAKRTDLVHGITIGLLDDHKVDQAKQFFEAEQGNIDMRASELLGNAVKTEYDRNLTETKGDALLAAAASAHPSEYTAVPNPKGMVQQGNLPIWNRPVIQNADGTHSSEYSTSFQDDQGREVLVPTVVNGKFLTPDGTKPAEGSAAEKTMFQAAWDHYLKTGENLGKFDSAEDADAYSQQLHSRDMSGGAAKTPYTYGPLATGSTINPMRITDVPGSPRPGGRTHDGYDIAMPAGTQVTAPLDGKVVKVWNDEKFGGGLSMQVQLSDGNTLGIAHLSAANLNEGDTVNQGQVIALSGKTGNATGNVLHVALTDPDGKKIDYFGASKAQPDQANVADPNVLERAIDAAKSDSSLDPYQQKRVISYMESQHTHERQIQEQQYQEVKQQAVDYYYQHNGIDGLPAAIKAQLKPEDLHNLSQPPASETDPETMANFILKPDQVTVPNVQSAFAQQKLSNGAYYSLLKDAMDNAQNPQKVIDATVEADRLKYFADQAGIPDMYKTENEADKRAYAQLLVRTQQEIDQAQQQKQGKLSQSEKDAIIQRNVQQHTITHLRSAWNPLSWIPGHETWQQTVRGFQMPPGATGTAKAPDGKLHFTDGKNDLGVVPE